MSRIKSGEVSGTKHLPAIAAALGVAVEWLTTGAEAYAPPWARPVTGQMGGALGGMTVQATAQVRDPTTAELLARLESQAAEIADLKRRLAIEQERRQSAERVLPPQPVKSA